MRARAAARGAALALLLGACAIPIGRSGQSFGRKMVAAKYEQQAVLVADDGARCQVDRDAFDRAQVGREFTCLWDDRNATAPRPADGAREPESTRRPIRPPW